MELGDKKGLKLSLEEIALPVDDVLLFPGDNPEVVTMTGFIIDLAADLVTVCDVRLTGVDRIGGEFNDKNIFCKRLEGERERFSSCGVECLGETPLLLISGGDENENRFCKIVVGDSDRLI